MGIKGLTSWIHRNFPKSFISRNKLVTPFAIDHLYLDGNTLLHILLRHATHEIFLIRSFYEALDQLLAEFPPRRSFTIALDGPSPLAKLLLQKRRRAATSSEYKTRSAFSPLDLTPGTELMQALGNACRFYACSKILENSTIRIIVNDSESPGEGEHKIIAEMQRNRTKAKTSESHVIVAEDSDLFSMSLCTGIEEIYILRNDALYDVDKIAAKLQRSTTRRKSVLRDFSLATTLSGNDYFPQVQGVNWNALWSVYSEVCDPVGGIVQDDFSLNLSNLSCWLNQIVPISDGNTRVLCEKEQKAVEHYLHGLQWNLIMNSTGLCPDYEYYHQNFRAPSAFNLCLYARNHPQFPLKSFSFKSTALTPRAFLLAVLPPHGDYLVPKPLRRIFSESFSEEYYEFDERWQPIPPFDTVTAILELISAINLPLLSSSQQDAFIEYSKEDLVLSLHSHTKTPIPDAPPGCTALDSNAMKVVRILRRDQASLEGDNLCPLVKRHLSHSRFEEAPKRRRESDGGGSGNLSKRLKR